MIHKRVSNAASEAGRREWGRVRTSVLVAIVFWATYGVLTLATSPTMIRTVAPMMPMVLTSRGPVEQTPNEDGSIDFRFQARRFLQDRCATRVTSFWEYRGPAGGWRVADGRNGAPLVSCPGCAFPPARGDGATTSPVNRASKPGVYRLTVLYECGSRPAVTVAGEDGEPAQKAAGVIWYDNGHFGPFEITRQPLGSGPL